LSFLVDCDILILRRTSMNKEDLYYIWSVSVTVLLIGVILYSIIISIIANDLSNQIRGGEYYVGCKE
jgi:galactitol-specific phosphotransferase system IIC component